MKYSYEDNLRGGYSHVFRFDWRVYFYIAVTDAPSQEVGRQIDAPQVQDKL